jgi:hypothetical protein
VILHGSPPANNPLELDELLELELPRPKLALDELELEPRPSDPLEEEELLELDELELLELPRPSDPLELLLELWLLLLLCELAELCELWLLILD